MLLACVLAAVVFSTSTALGQRPTDLVGHSFEGRVIGVVDGDTVDVLRAHTKRTVRIRVDGVDTPEAGEPFTQQAKNFTRVFAFDQDVIVVGKDVDRYWAPGVPKPACVTAAAGPPRSAVSAVAGATSSTFFGNVNSRVYHAPTCRNAHCKNCTREFHSRAEAEAAGFRAAGDCLK